jgi:hypothetical protein
LECALRRMHGAQRFRCDALGAGSNGCRQTHGNGAGSVPAGRRAAAWRGCLQHGQTSPSTYRERQPWARH